MGDYASTMPSESTRTVWIALLSGLGVALAKVGAAIVTSSPAMAAEASHSLADTANDLFFVLAQRRSARPRDEHHPFGFGREAYFWALIAALGTFVAGAAFSLREGINELIHPSATSSFAVAYVVLGVSALLDLASLRQSAHQMSVEARLANRSLLDQAATTSDPSLRGVFNEDAVSVAGDVFALIGLALSQMTGFVHPTGDCRGADCAGARPHQSSPRQTQSRLPSRPTNPGARPGPSANLPRRLPRRHCHSRASCDLYIGPEQVWVLARIDVGDDLRIDQVTSLVRGIEQGLQHESEFIYRVDVVPVGEKRAHPSVGDEGPTTAPSPD